MRIKIEAISWVIRFPYLSLQILTLNDSLLKKYFYYYEGDSLEKDSNVIYNKGANDNYNNNSENNILNFKLADKRITRLFNFLESSNNNNNKNEILANNFEKIVSSILKIKKFEFLDYLFNNDNIIELLLVNLNNESICVLIQNFINISNFEIVNYIDDVKYYLGESEINTEVLYNKNNYYFTKERINFLFKIIKNIEQSPNNVPLVNNILNIIIIPLIKLSFSDDTNNKDINEKVINTCIISSEFITLIFKILKINKKSLNTNIIITNLLSNILLFFKAEYLNKSKNLNTVDLEDEFPIITVLKENIENLVIELEQCLPKNMINNYLNTNGNVVEKLDFCYVYYIEILFNILKINIVDINLSFACSNIYTTLLKIFFKYKINNLTNNLIHKIFILLINKLSTSINTSLIKNKIFEQLFEYGIKIYKKENYYYNEFQLEYVIDIFKNLQLSDNKELFNVIKECYLISKRIHRF